MTFICLCDILISVTKGEIMMTDREFRDGIRSFKSESKLIRQVTDDIIKYGEQFEGNMAERTRSAAEAVYNWDAKKLNPIADDNKRFLNANREQIADFLADSGFSILEASWYDATDTFFVGENNVNHAAYTVYALVGAMLVDFLDNYQKPLDKSSN